LKASEAIYKVGFEQRGDKPFDSWADMARVLPELLKLEGYRTVWSLALQACARRAPTSASSACAIR
jgi:phytoene desaturase